MEKNKGPDLNTDTKTEWDGLQNTENPNFDTFEEATNLSWDDLGDLEFGDNRDHSPTPSYNEKLVSDMGRNVLENVLKSPEKLQQTAEIYLDQYDPHAETIARSIIGKRALDNYVIERLSSEHPDTFIASQEFKNYADYIMQMADQKKFTSNNGKICLYPEYFTNPVFKDSSMRNLIFKTAYPGANTDKMQAWFDQHQTEYHGYIKDFTENRMEKRQKLSQKQMDIVGDYIYAGENYDDGVAKKYAEYCFNEIKDDTQVRPSVPMIGALTNYFAKCYSGDETVKKESTFVIASHPDGNPQRKFNIGVSTPSGCILQKEHFLDMSLNSDKSLNKSRTNQHNDLYRLMMVSFHELTHDHQKSMVAKGDKSSSSMSYILNKVLNRGGLQCYEGKRADGSVVKGSYYNANHDNDEIEIQADEEAWMQCRKFLTEHQKLYAWQHHDKELEDKYYERWNKCLDNRQEVSARRVFTKKLASSGEEVSAIQYDIENLKQYIIDEPTILQKYPQLQEYLDPTGNLKLDLLFNQKIARVEYNNLDERTDTFGVEIGAYLLTKNSEVNRLAKYIQGNALDQTQINNFMGNMWNIVHQDALKSRVLKDINFNNYDETNARGKNQSPEELHDNLLNQYIRQCYNCIRLAEMIRRKYPETSEQISREENTYIGSYYPELSQKGKLHPKFAKQAIEIYTKTQNPTLMKIAQEMMSNYE